MLQKTAAATGKQRMPAALNIIVLTSFAAGLSARALDPLLPHVAQEFGVSIATAAGLSSGFAFTFAIVQPGVGAIADLFGKARVMIICLVLLGLANIVGAISTSFPALFVTRILAGISAGGVFPVAMGLTSDLVAPEKRQVAIGRLLAGALAGSLLGASLSGLIGDFLGWRGVLAMLSGLMIVTCIAIALGFRGAELKHPPKSNFSALKHGYRAIFANPNVICFAIVFVEGCCVMGIFPFIASFLFESGETRLSIAGFVIAGFAVGGLFYSFTVSRFLPWLGVKGMMIGGATLAAAQMVVVAFGPRWEIQLLSLLFMGWGFYMLHGCLQVFASELTTEARATALALHTFFYFMGQTVGPLAYGLGVERAGKITTLLTAAAVMMALGLFSAWFLKQTRPADANLRPADTAPT